MPLNALNTKPPNRLAYRLLAVLVSALLTAACGAEHKTDAPPVSSTQAEARPGLQARTLQGFFSQHSHADSTTQPITVEGLHFTTESTDGYTDSSGRYHYRSGEVIQFSIGNILLGTAHGASDLAPTDLDNDGTSTAPTNIQRLLITLDGDAMPNNGIQISEYVQAEALKLNPGSIDLSAATEEFERNPALLDFIGQVTNSSVLVELE